MTGREKTNPETPTTYEEYRAIELKDYGYGEGDDDHDFEDYFEDEERAKAYAKGQGKGGSMDHAKVDSSREVPLDDQGFAKQEPQCP